MKYGGVDSGPKQFTGGLDAEFLEQYDAGDIALLTATHQVGEKDNADEWTVDFAGLAEAFL